MSNIQTYYIDGAPVWKASNRAIRRLISEEVSWLNKPRRAYVAYLSIAKTPVVNIRCYPMHKRYMVHIEGFVFWHYSKVLQKNIFSPAKPFDNIKDAKKFVNSVINQAEEMKPFTIKVEA